MLKEEIAKEIESKFLSAIDLVKLTFKNGRAVHGSFEILEDHADLRKIHKFRFVPSHKAREFRYISLKEGKKNPVYSIIIDCDEIAKVEFV